MNTNHRWQPIDELPESLHSTPGNIRRLLIHTEKFGWQVGWYIGELKEWRMEGTNSEVFPTHFMDVGP